MRGGPMRPRRQASVRPRTRRIRRALGERRDLAPEQFILEGEARLRGGQLEDVHLLDGPVRLSVVGVDDGDYPRASQDGEDGALAAVRPPDRLGERRGKLRLVELQ